MPEIVLDTCCLVNLYASGELASILRTRGCRWYVPSAVEAEVIYTRQRDDTGQWVLRQAKLGEHLDAGLLSRCTAADPRETALYVELAAILQDGEAMALAIAQARKWVLATDDGKARREAKQRGVRIATTPALLRLWALAASVDAATVARTLLEVQQGARFEPSDAFPGHGWWRYVTQGQTA